jgi:hypothetical protein
LVKAGIAAIPDIETLQECVAYENAHQNRTQILRRLKWKAEELREGEDGAPFLTNTFCESFSFVG